MYRFLKGEIIKAGYSIKTLAKELGIAEKSLRNKINGSTDFTWTEALAIKRIIKSNMGIEELFTKEEKEVG